MKKIIQSIGLMSLICFSFMYTDKVMEVISEKDSLMVEIESKQNNYKIDVIKATIDNDTIIPGINGREIDVKESYKNMRELGVFREDLLIYYTTYPKTLLSNNYDKYIVGGNTAKQKVSLIFSIDYNDSPDIDSLKNILNKYNLKVNVFADINYLNSNIDKLINSNIEIYNYGEKANYTYENIVLAKNLIKSKTNKIPSFCLTSIKREDTMNICSSNKMWTIIPSIRGENTPYVNIKNSLKSGSLISLDINNITIKELPSIIDFIKGKGLSIVYLSELLTEELN